MDCPPCFGRVRLRVGRVGGVLIGTCCPWTADMLGSFLLFVVSQNGVPFDRDDGHLVGFLDSA